MKAKTRDEEEEEEEADDGELGFWQLYVCHCSSVFCLH